ncbi:MAG: tripartite tricarboxylate transporter permease [Chloroflexi bacterium]|nr:tripartite tricarboxylate transporter permease [Chloroflexota bacterium]
MNSIALLLAYAFLGTLLGTLLGLIPAMHIYAAAAFVIAAPATIDVPAGAPAFLCLGLLIGWAFSSNVPAIFLFAPDEGAATAVLPATRMLLQGRAEIALRMLVAGALGGLAVLLALSPIADTVLRPLLKIMQPHTTWMVIAALVFLVLGEWPRVDETHPTPLRRLAAAWAYLGAGQLTFWLSGLLGLVLMYRSPLPIDAAQQNLLPAFTGLFTLPGLLQITLFGAQPPPQIKHVEDPSFGSWLRGVLIGLGGGLFAAVLPVISGGIGSLLAGHASAQREERIFLIAQGASRTTYLTAGYLLLFLPGVAVARGGMSALLITRDAPAGWQMYWAAIGAAGICGATAAMLTLLCGALFARTAHRLPVRSVAVIALLIALTITWIFTGAAGLSVAAVGALIGMIPVLGGGRRMNALGVLLIPISLNLTGVGSNVAKFLGLLS